MVEDAVARALHEEPDLAGDKKEVLRLRKAMRTDSHLRWKTLTKDEKRKYKQQATGGRGGARRRVCA